MAIMLSPQFELDFTLGQDITWTDASGSGHTFPNDGHTVIWVENSSVVDVTLTMASARESDFGPYPSRTFVIPASSIRKTPTWNARRFTSPVTNLASFTLSTVTDVRVAALVQQQIFKDE